MPTVITMGETMAAFVPAAPGPLRYVADYRLRTAGSESNVAVGLAKLGVEVAWLTRLGEDEFGHFVCNQVRAEGVDFRHVRFDPERPTGVMFKQTGAGETRVTYYRKGSAASALAPEDLDPALFAQAQLLYLSGITPVLSESCRAAFAAAMELARAQGLRIAFDPNIRRKLWGGQDYTPLLREAALASDIVLLGREEAQALFGLDAPEAVLDRLLEGRARTVALKDGGNGAWVADTAGRCRIPPHPCRPVDPVGAGDGFNAGFLAGLLQGQSLEQAGRMGAVCGALATETPGDVEGYPDARQLQAILQRQTVIYR